MRILSCRKCSTIWANLHKIATSKWVEDKFDCSDEEGNNDIQALMSMKMKCRCLNSPTAVLIPNISF